MGLLPMLGVRLAKLTSNPDLVISDGESLFLAGVPPLFAKGDVVEGWIPFRKVFDVVAYGKRHVMMGATQVDRHGNQNISAIGDFAQPKRQLLGSRGAPGQHGQQPHVVLGARSTPPASSSSRSTSSPASARSGPRRPDRPPPASTTSTGSSATSAVFDVAGRRRHACGCSACTRA